MTFDDALFDRARMRRQFLIAAVAIPVVWLLVYFSQWEDSAPRELFLMVAGIPTIVSLVPLGFRSARVMYDYRVFVFLPFVIASTLSAISFGIRMEGFTYYIVVLGPFPLAFGLLVFLLLRAIDLLKRRGRDPE